MSSKPQRDAQGQPSDSSDRQPLPFEPKKSRKQSRKAEPKAAKVTHATATQKPEEGRSGKPAQPTASGIPEIVSRRMVKRMAVFCGIPTALGMSTFLFSYLIVVNDVYKIPTYAVLLVSLGFFGLGVLGLSYGALSASWEESEAAGSRLGWSEFTTNLGRMTGAWKANREEQRQAQKQGQSAGKKS